MRPHHRSRETADQSEADQSSRESRSNQVLFQPFPTGSAFPRTATPSPEGLSVAQTARPLPERSTRAPCRARIPRSRIRLLACAPRQSTAPTLDCSAGRPPGPATGISYNHPTSRCALTPLLAVAPSREPVPAPEVAHAAAAARHSIRPLGASPSGSSRALRHGPKPPPVKPPSISPVSTARWEAAPPVASGEPPSTDRACVSEAPRLAAPPVARNRAQRPSDEAVAYKALLR
jgi:hypothetical protein